MIGEICTVYFWLQYCSRLLGHIRKHSFVLKYGVDPGVIEKIV